MTPDDVERLEADLRRALTAPPPAARLHLLDERVSKAAAGASGPGALGRLRGAMATTSTLVGTALVIGVLVVAFANMPGQGPSGSDATDAEGMVAGTQQPAAAPPSGGPSDFSGLSPSPLIGTPEPTASPTPAATLPPEPTLAPTAIPTAPPDPDPEPEGTPRIFSASGSLGETLTVEGVGVTMYRIQLQEPLTTCDYAGRETWKYAFRMDWVNPPPSIEPWIALGSNPHGVVSFEPAFAPNTNISVILCHAPGDTEAILVESSPPGSPAIYYRWYFG